VQVGGHAGGNKAGGAGRIKQQIDAS
jgi:hypothetical protein